MLASAVPLRMQKPFGAGAGGGFIRTVPVASQIGITAGAASFTDGFPPLTMTPPGSGGVPPFGQDANGVLNAISAWNQWQAAGGPIIYDSTFANAASVNGYPAGARINALLGGGSVVPCAFWTSTVDSNTSNPDTGGSNWLLQYAYDTPISLSVAGSANVTLSPAQYGSKNITITGAITANISLIFPTSGGEWRVFNNTTGAFTVTAKTPSGSGVLLGQGFAASVWSDGTNIQYQSRYIGDLNVATLQASSSIQSFQFGSSANNGVTVPNNVATTVATFPATNIFPLTQGTDGGAYIIVRTTHASDALGGWCHVFFTYSTYAIASQGALGGSTFVYSMVGNLLKLTQTTGGSIVVDTKWTNLS